MVGNGNGIKTITVITILVTIMLALGGWWFGAFKSLADNVICNDRESRERDEMLRDRDERLREEVNTGIREQNKINQEILVTLERMQVTQQMILKKVQ